jgi:Family of unknown function (DUF5681)
MDEEIKPKRTAPPAFVEAGKVHRWKKGTSGNAWRIPPEFASFKWQPGQSGNPAGRPKSAKSLTKALQYCCDSLVPGDKEGRTFGQVIASHWVSLAARGNVRAMELLASRLEGQPPSHMTLAGAVEEKLRARGASANGRRPSQAAESGRNQSSRRSAGQSSELESKSRKPDEIEHGHLRPRHGSVQKARWRQGRHALSG